MSDEFFVDTNIIAYAFDESEKPKREATKAIFEDVTKGKKAGFVSNQVLAELYTVLTKKIGKPLKEEHAQTIVNGIIDSPHWGKVNYTAGTVSKAIQISARKKIHFWDALIIQTMLENGLQEILTENTCDFKTWQVKATNPFA